MLLVVDVRNRDTALGLVDDATIVDKWEVRTSDRTRDEWILLIRSLIRTSGVVPTTAILASVVPEATRVLRGVLPELSGTEPLVVGPGLKTGLAIDLDNAREVGADRVASAVGAIERHGAPAVVVGLGTVTTVDVIDGRQRFHGGSISVGVGVAAEALVTSTASLRRVELVAPSTAIGRNTVEAVQSGIVLGFAGRSADTTFLTPSRRGKWKSLRQQHCLSRGIEIYPKGKGAYCLRGKGKHAG